MTTKKPDPTKTHQANVPAPAPETSASAPPSPTPDAGVTPPERRGPGRPKGSGTKSPPVSPGEPGAAPANKPGRKPGKKNKVSFDNESLGTLAKQVQGLHAMVAMATGIPECQIDDVEAKTLGQAIATVCEEYDLSISGKTGALLQLAAAAAMIYAPRFMAISQRVKQAKAQREAARQTASSPVQIAGVTHGADAAHS